MTDKLFPDQPGGQSAQVIDIEILVCMEICEPEGTRVNRATNPGVLTYIQSDELQGDTRRIVLVKPGQPGYYPTPFHLPDISSAREACRRWNETHGYEEQEALDLVVSTLRGH